MRFSTQIAAMLLCSVVAAPTFAQDAAGRKALFGEMHMHTHWSFDAYLFNTRATPDDAYKFAKGAPLKHPLGQTYQLDKPLDFMAVTDHGFFLGVHARISDPNHPMSKMEIAKKLAADRGQFLGAGFAELTAAGRAGKEIPGLTTDDSKLEAWEYIVEAANRHNDPGEFTTFIAYEYTCTPDGQNLHRNVIFKGDSAPVPFTTFDSMKPEDLWKWMDGVRAEGTDVLAIPHNSNLSDGRMFERQDSDDRPFTSAYADLRNRNEPLVEVTQVKGTSEAHPELSPNDEFADFELLETYVASAIPVTKFAGSYVRDAYRTGLEFQDTNGFNPYRFGLIAASDSHTCIVPVLEKNYSGKVGTNDGSPAGRLQGRGSARYRHFSASGLTGVWAEENTRDRIFDAMRRKETWGTSGPRIQVRFFGGWNLDGVDPADSGWVSAAYDKATPMGSALSAKDASGSPEFVVWAIKDSDSANLDRVQIVKGWSVDGKSQEKVYDVVWSGDREIDSKTGKLSAVGNTINPETLEYTNTIGAVELKGTWTDPDFDPALNAFYYVRVLEIPTPRWSAFDAQRLGVPHPDDLHAAIQERAYTSPIWFDAD